MDVPAPSWSTPWQYRAQPPTSSPLVHRRGITQHLVRHPQPEPELRSLDPEGTAEVRWRRRRLRTSKRSRPLSNPSSTLLDPPRSSCSFGPQGDSGNGAVDGKAGHGICFVRWRNPGQILLNESGCPPLASLGVVLPFPDHLLPGTACKIECQISRRTMLRRSRVVVALAKSSALRAFWASSGSSDFSEAALSAKILTVIKS